MQTTKSLLLALLVGGAVCGITSPASATVTLYLEPSAQNVDTGAFVSVDLKVEGLSDLAAPSLAGFDLDIYYDPAILASTFVIFGSNLDYGAGSARNADFSVPGILHLDELSAESAGDLNANQPGAFTLATLGFTSLGFGTSPVSISVVSLLDETGQTIQDFEARDAEITVAPTASVPDTGSALSLMLIGLASLAGFRGRAGLLPKS